VLCVSRAQKRFVLAASSYLWVPERGCVRDCVVVEYHVLASEVAVRDDRARLDVAQPRQHALFQLVDEVLQHARVRLERRLGQHDPEEHVVVHVFQEGTHRHVRVGLRGQMHRRVPRERLQGARV